MKSQLPNLLGVIVCATFIVGCGEVRKTESFRDSTAVYSSAPPDPENGENGENGEDGEGRRGGSEFRDDQNRSEEIRAIATEKSYSSPDPENDDEDGDEGRRGGSEFKDSSDKP